MTARRILPLLILLAVPLVALSQGPAGDKAAPRRKLDKYRADSARFNRLRQDLDAHLALPPERQQQLRKLDEDLHEQPSSLQAQLFHVMERYADWLERLPEAKREYILEPKDKATRLQRIRELREQEWLAKQPKATREWLARLKPRPAYSSAVLAIGQVSSPAFLGIPLAPLTDRDQVVHKLRHDERQQKINWQIATRHWNELMDPTKKMPVRAADFGKDAKEYIEEYLKPRFSPEERARLQVAEGKWPQYAYTLVELADKHPLALPGVNGPKKVNDLPKEIQEEIKEGFGKSPFSKGGGPGGKGGGKGGDKGKFDFSKLKGDSIAKKLQPHENKWPEFGAALAKIGVDRNLSLSTRFEFLPTSTGQLSDEMRNFVVRKLLTTVTEDEAKSFFELEGKKLWPDFPNRIQELANKYHMTPPWQTLPGPREKWNAYRLKSVVSFNDLPELPPQMLRDFVVTELKPHEREVLMISAADPQGSFQRATEEFFKRHPNELQAMRMKDAQHQHKGDSFQKGPRPLPKKRGDF